MKNSEDVFEQTKLMTIDINFKISTKIWQVPPRFELGLQDSESWVLTITPWDLGGQRAVRL